MRSCPIRPSRPAPSRMMMAALGFAGIAGLSVGAQQTPIYRSGVELTRVKVAVFDRDGNPVAGLTVEDFRVFENGEQQRLDVVLAPADIPLDIALVVDFSASVDAEWPDPQPRDAAEDFLDSLSPADCVYLLPFQENVGPGVWGAAASRDLRERVRHFPYGWSTRLYDAIRDAHAALDRRAPDYSLVPPATGSPEPGDCAAPLAPDEVLKRRAAIVVLTDGEDTGSSVEYADVLLASYESDRPVFTVAVGMAGGDRNRSRHLSTRAYQANDYNDSLQDRLAELSRVSGGHLVTQRQIDDGYETVLSLLRGYYVLGYRTPRPVREGWNGVQVEVANDYQTVTQPGIYRTSTDYSRVRGALRTATADLNRDPDNALTMLDIVVELAPDLAVAHFGRGVILERMQRLASARQAFERALWLSPGSLEARFRLARVALRQKDYPAAWLHALRVGRAGADASAVLDPLGLAAAAPNDIDARRSGPRLAFPKPLTPDLDAQLALAPVWREIAARFEEDPSVTIVPPGARPDFVIRIELERLENRPPRSARLHLQLLDTFERGEEQVPLEVGDIEDPELTGPAAARAVEAARTWVGSRMRRRR